MGVDQPEALWDWVCDLARTLHVALKLERMWSCIGLLPVRELSLAWECL